MNKHTKEWDNTFVTHIRGKTLIPKIYKECL